MALFKPFNGNRANLTVERVPLTEGHAYFCVDDGTFYIDANVNGTLTRIQVNAGNAETLCGMSLDELKQQFIQAPTFEFKDEFIKQGDVFGEKIYFNTALSNQEVDAYLSTLTYGPGGVAIIITDNEESPTLGLVAIDASVSQEGQGYVVIDMMSNTYVFISESFADVSPFPTGWNVESLDVPSDLQGTPIGYVLDGQIIASHQIVSSPSYLIGITEDGAVGKLVAPTGGNGAELPKVFSPYFIGTPLHDGVQFDTSVDLDAFAEVEFAKVSEDVSSIEYPTYTDIELPPEKLVEDYNKYIYLDNNTLYFDTSKNIDEWISTASDSKVMTLFNSPEGVSYDLEIIDCNLESETGYLLRFQACGIIYATNDVSDTVKQTYGISNPGWQVDHCKFTFPSPWRVDYLSDESINDFISARQFGKTYEASPFLLLEKTGSEGDYSYTLRDYNGTIYYTTADGWIRDTFSSVLNSAVGKYIQNTKHFPFLTYEVTNISKTPAKVGNLIVQPYRLNTDLNLDEYLASLDWVNSTGNTIPLCTITDTESSGTADWLLAEKITDNSEDVYVIRGQIYFDLIIYYCSTNASDDFIKNYQRNFPYLKRGWNFTCAPCPDSPIFEFIENNGNILRIASLPSLNFFSEIEEENKVSKYRLEAVNGKIKWSLVDEDENQANSSTVAPLKNGDNYPEFIYFDTSKDITDILANIAYPDTGIAILASFNNNLHMVAADVGLFMGASAGAAGYIFGAMSIEDGEAEPRGVDLWFVSSGVPEEALNQFCCFHGWNQRLVYTGDFVDSTISISSNDILQLLYAEDICKTPHSKTALGDYYKIFRGDETSLISAFETISTKLFFETAKRCNEKVGVSNGLGVEGNGGTGFIWEFEKPLLSNLAIDSELKLFSIAPQDGYSNLALTMGNSLLGENYSYSYFAIVGVPEKLLEKPITKLPVGIEDYYPECIYFNTNENIDNWLSNLGYSEVVPGYNMSLILSFNDTQTEGIAAFKFSTADGDVYLLLYGDIAKMDSQLTTTIYCSANPIDHPNVYNNFWQQNNCRYGWNLKKLYTGDLKDRFTNQYLSMNRDGYPLEPNFIITGDIDPEFPDIILNQIEFCDLSAAADAMNNAPTRGARFYETVKLCNNILLNNDVVVRKARGDNNLFYMPGSLFTNSIMTVEDIEGEVVGEVFFTTHYDGRYIAGMKTIKESSINSPLKVGDVINGPIYFDITRNIDDWLKGLEYTNDECVLVEINGNPIVYAARSSFGTDDLGAIRYNYSVSVGDLLAYCYFPDENYFQNIIKMHYEILGPSQGLFYISQGWNIGQVSGVTNVTVTYLAEGLDFAYLESLGNMPLSSGDILSATGSIYIDVAKSPEGWFENLLFTWSSDDDIEFEGLKARICPIITGSSLDGSFEEESLGIVIKTRDNLFDGKPGYAIIVGGEVPIYYSFNLAITLGKESSGWLMSVLPNLFETDIEIVNAIGIQQFFYLNPVSASGENWGEIKIPQNGIKGQALIKDNAGVKWGDVLPQTPMVSFPIEKGNLVQHYAFGFDTTLNLDDFLSTLFKDMPDSDLSFIPLYETRDYLYELGGQIAEGESFYTNGIYFDTSKNIDQWLEETFLALAETHYVKVFDDSRVDMGSFLGIETETSLDGGTAYVLKDTGDTNTIYYSTAATNRAEKGWNQDYFWVSAIPTYITVNTAIEGVTDFLLSCDPSADNSINPLIKAVRKKYSDGKYLFGLVDKKAEDFDIENFENVYYISTENLSEATEQQSSVGGWKKSEVSEETLSELHNKQFISVPEISFIKTLPILDTGYLKRGDFISKMGGPSGQCLCQLGLNTNLNLDDFLQSLFTNSTSNSICLYDAFADSMGNDLFGPNGFIAASRFSNGLIVIISQIDTEIKLLYISYTGEISQYEMLALRMLGFYTKELKRGWQTDTVFSDEVLKYYDQKVMDVSITTVPAVPFVSKVMKFQDYTFNRVGDDFQWTPAIKVDAELSETSENPIQNKAVSLKFAELETNIASEFIQMPKEDKKLLQEGDSFSILNFDTSLDIDNYLASLTYSEDETQDIGDKTYLTGKILNINFNLGDSGLPFILAIKNENGADGNPMYGIMTQEGVIYASKNFVLDETFTKNGWYTSQYDAAEGALKDYITNGFIPFPFIASYVEANQNFIINLEGSLSGLLERTEDGNIKWVSRNEFSSRKKEISLEYSEEEIEIDKETYDLLYSNDDCIFTVTGLNGTDTFQTIYMVPLNRASLFATGKFFTGSAVAGDGGVAVVAGVSMEENKYIVKMSQKKINSGALKDTKILHRASATGQIIWLKSDMVDYVSWGDGTYDFFGSMYHAYAISGNYLITAGGLKSLPKFGSLDYDHDELLYIEIGTDIVEIPEETFARCISLTQVSIPDTVKTIASNAFAGCIGLTEVWVSSQCNVAADAFPETTVVHRRALIEDLATKADLVDGKVPTSQLPSYVDDVLEYDTYNSLPATGETSKIYVTLDDNKTYRWGGSAYVEISASLALGETSATAYRGDRGKVAYDHSQTTSGNPHNVTKSDVGLGNVQNIDATNATNITSGILPDERLSSNIARTSQIPTFTVEGEVLILG